MTGYVVAAVVVDEDDSDLRSAAATLVLGSWTPSMISSSHLVHLALLVFSFLSLKIRGQIQDEML